jgi:hypothetical protein
MSDGPEFFQTRMGQAFFEGTMPRLAKALETIADVLAQMPLSRPAPGVLVATITEAERREARQALVYEKALKFVRTLATAQRTAANADVVDAARRLVAEAEAAWQ